MSLVKITAVSYLNTLPFLYGIEQTGISSMGVEVDLQPPFLCAQKLLNQECDIALVPVAVLNELNTYNIISNYCIGAEGYVQTVVLVSNIALDKVTKIYLDYQSRTSVMLAKILAKYWWRIEVEWISANPDYLEILDANAAYVIIGDRVFTNVNRFSIILDLAHEWQLFQSLPFVFATWVSLKPIRVDLHKALNNAFEYGVKHIPELVNKIKDNYQIPGLDLLDYYTDKISYHLTDDKHKAMLRYLELMRTI